MTFFLRRYTDGLQVHEKIFNITNHQGNVNQTQLDNTAHLSEWPSSLSLQTINAGEGAEKRKPSYTVGGKVHWCSHYGEQYGGSLKNYK